MKRIPFSTIVGALLILLAAMTPSVTLLRALRSPGAEITEPLMQGALLFRLVTAALGLATILLGEYARRFPCEPLAAKPERAGQPWHLAAAVLLMAISLGLRLPALDAGLWFDEIATWVHYTSRSFGDTITTYDLQNQHFLFTVASKVSMAIFGASEGAFRLPAVLFGVASIGALFLFARRTVGSLEGLLACALLTFSYHHVWFSQNARGYTGLLFWTLLTAYLLVRGLEENRPRIWVVFAVATALGFYTHLTMLFATAAQGLIWLAIAPRAGRVAWPVRLNGLLFGFGLAGLLSTWCYALVLPQLFGGTLEEGGAVEEWRNPLWALIEIARGLQVGAAHAAVLGVGLVGTALGVWRLWRRSRITLSLFLLSVGVCALVVVGTGHHVWPRLFFFAAGFGILLVIAGTMAGAELLARMLRWGPPAAIRLGTGVCIGLIAVSAWTVPRAYAPKQDFRGAMAFVERQRSPGDAVVTAGLTVMPYRDYYPTDWRPVDNLAGLDEIRRGADRTWLLYTLPFHLKALAPGVFEAVENEFEPVEGFPGTLGGGTVWVCRYDRPTPAAPEATPGPVAGVEQDDNR